MRRNPPRRKVVRALRHTSENRDFRPGIEDAKFQLLENGEAFKKRDDTGPTSLGHWRTKMVPPQNVRWTSAFVDGGLAQGRKIER